jgi:hypothetical protein
MSPLWKLKMLELESAFEAAIKLAVERDRLARPETSVEKLDDCFGATSCELEISGKKFNLACVEYRGDRLGGADATKFRVRFVLEGDVLIGGDDGK